MQGYGDLHAVRSANVLAQVPENLGAAYETGSYAFKTKHERMEVLFV
jgi:hypothetical protein